LDKARRELFAAGKDAEYEAMVKEMNASETTAGQTWFETLLDAIGMDQEEYYETY